MEIGENILIICTYEELGQAYRRALEKSGLRIDLEVMDNRYGRDMAKVLDHIGRFRARGKEIVITRGFLARQIREHLDYRVIEIHISGVDVLRTLLPYAGRDLLVGVVECRAFLQVVTPVARMLGLRVREYEVRELEDFDRGISQAAQDRADLIVGGAWRQYDAENAARWSIPYLSIESSEESIEASLNNALEIYRLTYQERRRKELMETVVAFSDGGVLALDEAGRPLVANAYIRELCGARGEWSRRETELVRQALAEEEGGAFPVLASVNGQTVLVNRVPLLVERDLAGEVITMKRAEQVRADETLVRTELAKKGLNAKYTLDDIQGRSALIRDLKGLARTYAGTEATVLLLGESGTGKELFAQAIHNASPRKNSPFVAINCSSLPPSLLESELFGYVDGAFTGARRGGKVGVFELASGGTIFLDEIGDMDLGMQSRLLRVVQEREVMRIGDNRVISVDVRIVAATNRDLYQAVEEGRFREDLYYRLNTLDLRIPPLRERREDIPDIAAGALAGINRRLNCSVTAFEPRVLEKLQAYEWRGNIRELISVLEKMAVVVRYGTVRYDRVEFLFREMDLRRQGGRREFPAWEGMTLREAEAALIRGALERCGGNKTRAAALLGVDRTTLLRKCRQE